MLDSMFEKYISNRSLTQRSASLEETPADVHNDENVRKFNPLEGLGVESGTPNSFYQLQSAIRTFRPIHDLREMKSIRFTFLDLDASDGCLMAIQGLYPNSRQFSLTKQLSPNAYINLGKVNMEATSPYGLARICRFANLRGIPLAYCSQTESRKDTINRVIACVGCVSMETGMMFVETQNYASALFKDLWLFLSSKFSEVILYKPGVMSCVRKCALIVCYEKHLGQENNQEKFLQEMQRQVDVLEKYRLLSIEAVKLGEDNKSSFDVMSHVADYINI